MLLFLPKKFDISISSNQSNRRGWTSQEAKTKYCLVYTIPFQILI